MIHKLSLFDFRNYTERRFEFSEKNIVFFGGNGRGKTNILEALSVLSVGASWRENSPADLIRMGSSSAKIETTAEENSYQVIIEPRSRTFHRNQKKISLRKHFGALPSLLFVPEFLTLFSGPKRDRQRFFDRFLFQTNGLYRETLSRCMRAVRQKNTLLRDQSSNSEIESWNEILAETIPQIFEMRQNFLREISLPLQKEFSRISKTSEPLSLGLRTAEKWEAASHRVRDFFQKNLLRERAAQRCLIGPHRDDFVFFLRDKEACMTASRGEERTIMIALLSAQKQLLLQALGTDPMLLLDDVFSELDQSRQDQLDSLCNGSQTFFTTTHQSHFENFSRKVQSFEI